MRKRIHHGDCTAALGPDCSAAYLAGSIQAGNVYATDICGTTTMAGWKLSVISVVGFSGQFLSCFFMDHVKNNTEKGKSFCLLVKGSAWRTWMRAYQRTVFRTTSKYPSFSGGTGDERCFQICSKSTICRLYPDHHYGTQEPAAKVKDQFVTGDHCCLWSYFKCFRYVCHWCSGEKHRRIYLFSEHAVCIATSYERKPYGTLAAFIMASVAAPIPAFGSHMLEQYTLAGLKRR